MHLYITSDYVNSYGDVKVSDLLIARIIVDSSRLRLQHLDLFIDEGNKLLPFIMVGQGRVKATMCCQKFPCVDCIELIEA